jgi:hypothetical protein
VIARSLTASPAALRSIHRRPARRIRARKLAQLALFGARALLRTKGACGSVSLRMAGNRLRELPLYGISARLRAASSKPLPTAATAPFVPLTSHAD